MSTRSARLLIPLLGYWTCYSRGIIQNYNKTLKHYYVYRVYILHGFCERLVSVFLGWVRGPAKAEISFTSSIFFIRPAAQGNYSKLLQNFYVYT